MDVLLLVKLKIFKNVPMYLEEYLFAGLSAVMDSLIEKHNAMLRQRL